jgi:serine protease AprX
MTVSSRALVELVLLGPISNRRQLQDSPVLGDVWIEYAMKPTQAIDLLITPDRQAPAGRIASSITRRVAALKLTRADGQESQVAYLQGLVAARLFFSELLRIVVPMTNWWNEPKIKAGLKEHSEDAELLENKLQAVINWTRAKTEDQLTKTSEVFGTFSSLERYISLAGVILWASSKTNNKNSLGAGDAIAKLKSAGPIVEVLGKAFSSIRKDPELSDPKKVPRIWQVSLNRKASPALHRSVPSVKGDAARTLFNVKCDSITWAVLDSGIDGNHPVFNDKKGNSRILKAFDFSNIRKIVSLDNLNTETSAFADRLDELRAGREKDLSVKEARSILKKLAEDAENDRPLHWEWVERFITIDPKTATPSKHGTHVAGIIGANASQQAAEAVTEGFNDGMCPDIKFYDFRVLAKSLEDTEFAIIAALQYLRYINQRHTYLSIHGANLSLSIPHDVRNFACGRTPICNECERLVESGVVVVAAAGNLGYQRFETKDGSYEGYTAFSVTDPGNADGVITVGATHRYKPHTYGVSFFSSRGPTGDGRLKPDLVAPGERIESSLPNNEWGELDGTSMAAPHVSGAAAMLMARYDELIGEPRRIKRILCESATDLGRERSFQGHGMLDVLRAFQSI